MAQIASAENDIARTYALLGGKATIRKPIRNNLEAHDILTSGLPSAALLHLTSQVAFLTTDAVLEKAIGISVRTLQRRKKDAPDAVLSVDQSNRTWKFAEILGRATDIFGTKAAAETWLNAPAIGLDQRRPIDLLSTAVGVEAVEDYLTRIEYGVYA
nr:antitoxin Xre/MbcA/ParS toxin-binding domain-containing protein [uncultured Cohaesibacter sp.]